MGSYAKLAGVIPGLQLQSATVCATFATISTYATTSVVYSDMVEELHATVLRPDKFTPTSKARAGADTRASKRRALRQQVNIIDAISGGSNEPVLEKKRQRKEYFRTVSHVSESRCFRTTWLHVPISFKQADLRLQHYPHNDGRCGGDTGPLPEQGTGLGP